jgi:alpha-glucoside transport system substrate-binding protein
LNINKKYIFLITSIIITFGFSLYAYNPSEVVVIGPEFHEKEYFKEELANLSEELNISIKYKVVNDPESYIIENRNSKISIALIPNPQAVTNLANRGKIYSLDNIVIDGDNLKGLYPSHLTNIVTHNNSIYSGWLRLFPNSLIWYDISKLNKYPEVDFTTFESLLNSTKDLADKNISPWCAGSESAASTGWIQTNWMEDILLTKYGPVIYDKWSRLEIAASNVKIYSTLNLLGDFIFYPSMIENGHPEIYYREFRNLPRRLLDENYECFLSWSGHYFKYYIPEEYKYKEDFGVIKLPSITFQDSIVGIGDTLVLIENNQDSVKTLQALLSKNFGEVWAQKHDSEFISANKNFNYSLINNSLTRYEFEITHAALKNDMFRYDASEIMPRPIGANLLWKMLIEYVKQGEDSLVQLLNKLDKEI